MRTRLTCTITAVGLLAAMSAATAQSPGRNQAGALRALAVRDAATGLLRAGVPRRTLAAAGLIQDDSGSSSVVVVFGPNGGAFLEPAGDLDGNGAKDVLESRYVGGSSPKDLGLYGRDGGTGRLLWQRTAHIPKNHFMFAFPALTGAAGQAGVLLVDMAFTDDNTQNNTSVTSTTIRLVGYDGRGRQLWSHTETGTDSWDGSALTYKHEPQIAGVISGSGRRPDSVLISVADGSRPTGSSSPDDPTADHSHGSVQPFALNARTGKLRAVGPAASSTDGFPAVQTVPDFSGDGRDDIALLSPGSKPRLELRRETDAKSIWTSTAVALSDWAYVQSAGRVTGAKVGRVGVPDLAVVAPPVTSLSDELANSLPVGAPSAGAGHGTVSLVSGSGGAVVWSKPGDSAYAVERAGPSLVPALGVTSTETTSDANTVTATLTVTTYDTKGAALYALTRTASAPVDPESAGWDAGGFAIAVGHLSATTAVDGVALVYVISGNSFNYDTFLFAGQSGKGLPSGTSTPLGASTTGHGDDLVSTSTKGTLTVTVRRGTDAALRFSRALPGATGYDGAEAYGAVLQPGRCADVLVDAASKSGRRLHAVLASDGRPRWWLTHTDKDLRPGTVRRAAAPHPACR